MEVVVHASLSLFPLVLVAIIYGDSCRMGFRDLESRLFRLAALSVLAALVTETLTWLPSGSFSFVGPLIGVTMVLYLLSVGAVGPPWALYIISQVRGIDDVRDLKSYKRICLAAYLMYVAFLFVSVPPGLLFTVDEANAYHRGPLFALPYIFMGTFMVIGAALALRRLTTEVHHERRHDFGSLAVFGVVPICGMVIQLIFPQWWLAWPFTAIALLLAYVSIQNVRITEDPLTGLGNRAHFDEQLSLRWNHAHENPWCLIMVDVDEFKRINDRFGHAFGDEVLCMVADDLRETFEDEDVCIARYGGDEFAVIAPCSDQQELADKLERLNRAMARTSCSLESRAFSFSAGGALCDRSSQEHVENLIAQADRAMYAIKGKLRIAQGVESGGGSQ